jgi:hypothetical protein
VNFRRRRIVHRSDPNQPEIVKFARSVGATVDIIGEPVDLLVGWKGRNLLWEVKPDPKAKLRPSQVEFFEKWRGSVERIDSVEDAARSLGVEPPHRPVS